jgi:hypothetical protein
VQSIITVQGCAWDGKKKSGAIMIIAMHWPVAVAHG